jgi:drug/metabolite transporter (DMT)-like permease
MIIQTNEKGSGQQTSLWGEFFAVISNLFWVSQLISSNQVLKSTKPFLLVFSQSIGMFVVFTTWYISVNGLDTISYDKTVGVFGEFAAENFWLSVLVVGPFTQTLGFGGFTFSLLFASPLVAGNVFTLEPICG